MSDFSESIFWVFQRCIVGQVKGGMKTGRSERKEEREQVIRRNACTRCRSPYLRVLADPDRSGFMRQFPYLVALFQVQNKHE